MTASMFPEIRRQDPTEEPPGHHPGRALTRDFSMAAAGRIG